MISVIPALPVIPIVPLVTIVPTLMIITTFSSLLIIGASALLTLLTSVITPSFLLVPIVVFVDCFLLIALVADVLLRESASAQFDCNLRM